jgi:hypothetical protein
MAIHIDPKSKKVRLAAAAGIVGFFVAVAAQLTGGSSITIVAAASRTSCVAPCAVHFDATATTASGVTYPFHELAYEWDFDDTGAGTWSNSPTGASKETDIGAVATHVYESAGTYVAALHVRAPNGDTADDTLTITVTAGDSQWTGTTTRCICDTSNFTGCPAGATTAVTGDFDAALTTHVAAGRRVLFCRDGEFASSTHFSLNVAGPGMLGAYGSGADPIVDCTATWLRLSGSTANLDDWRIVDFDVRGSGADVDGISSSGTHDHVLMQRLTMQDFAGLIRFSTSVTEFEGQPPYEFVFVVENDLQQSIGGGGGYLVYGSGHKFAILGNYMHDSTAGEHVERHPYATRTIIAHNDMGEQATDKSVFTLRSSTFGSGLPETIYVVISDNKVTGGLGAWTLSLDPSSAATDERIADVILERNWVLGGSGSQDAMILFGDRLTVRNNIINLGGNVSTGINLGHRGAEPEHVDNWIFNNVCQTNAVESANRCIQIHATLTQSIIANILLSAPNTTTPVVVLDNSGGANTLADNVSVNDPDFAVEPPTVPADYALTAGSTECIDQGTNFDALNAVGDWLNNQRKFNGGVSLTTDIGPYEYLSTPYP